MSDDKILGIHLDTATCIKKVNGYLKKSTRSILSIGEELSKVKNEKDNLPKNTSARERAEKDYSLMFIQLPFGETVGKKFMDIYNDRFIHKYVNYCPSAYNTLYDDLRKLTEETWNKLIEKGLCPTSTGVEIKKMKEEIAKETRKSKDTDTDDTSSNTSNETETKSDNTTTESNESESKKQNTTEDSNDNSTSDDSTNETESNQTSEDTTTDETDEDVKEFEKLAEDDSPTETFFKVKIDLKKFDANKDGEKYEKLEQLLEHLDFTEDFYSKLQIDGVELEHDNSFYNYRSRSLEKVA